MRDLPLEIFKKIFRCLEQKDLQTCYFVCKSWYYAAIPLNWEEVTLSTSKTGLVISYIHDVNLRQYFKYGYLITKLTIKDTEKIHCKINYEFSKPELLVLLSLLPNLKEIDMSSSRNVEKYTGFLVDADLKHISKIGTEYFSCFDGDNYTYDLLILVYYGSRDTITHIDLYYDKPTIYVGSQHINILDSLTEFKKLTELSLYNDHDKNLTPFQVQDNCPNLEKLKYSRGFSISESAMLGRLRNNINLNFVASLRKLELVLPSLSAAFTRYLVDYFPKQLTYLTITTSVQNPFTWIDSVRMGLALRFMENVGRIEEVSINFSLLDPYEAQPNEENNMTNILSY